MDDFIEFIVTFVVVILVVGMFSLLFAYPILWLWNWLMPVLFDLTTITYWQAVGLNLLSSLLLKSTQTSKN